MPHLGTVKVSLVGTTSVGKTCLINRIIHGTFVETSPTTSMRVDPLRVTATSGRTISINFWDTAGQEKYKSLSTMYYHGCACCIAVFDLTSEHSFTEMLEYIQMYRNVAGQDAPVVVAGNKCDLIENESGIMSIWSSQCADMGLNMFTTSAKTGKGCEDMMTYIADLIDEAHKAEPGVAREITIEDEKPQKSRCCSNL